MILPGNDRKMLEKWWLLCGESVNELWAKKDKNNTIEKMINKLEDFLEEEKME